MAERLIREIPLIQRYSRHNQAEDDQFRVFMKERLNLSNAELDAFVHEITDTVWQQIECTDCGHCCRTLYIVVDDKDINRLSTRLKITPKQFARKYVAVADDGTKLFHSTPCPFLNSENYCTVYEDRPQACRDFPFLQEAGFRTRSITILEMVGVCPIVFNVWQALKNRFKANILRLGRTVL